MKHLRFLGLMIYLISAFANKTYAETWNCGEKDSDGNYGANVKCTLDEKGNFTVSGTGKMADFEFARDPNYSDGTFPASTAPWGDSNRVKMGKIQKIVVEEGVTRIGDNAFLGASHVTSVSAPSITSIGAHAFHDAYGLKEINIPKTEEIGLHAFIFAISLKNIEIPNIKNIDHAAFANASRLEYAELGNTVSLGNSVFFGSKISSCTGGICANCGEKFVQAGVGCVSSCYTGYTSYYGFCSRTRYTLPEADAATSDDNENMIEWIFE